MAEAIASIKVRCDTSEIEDAIVKLEILRQKSESIQRKGHMPPVVHLILILAAFLFGCGAVYVSGPGLTWQRLLSAALTLLIASMITWS
jgi:hypothetical protein